MGTLTLGVSVVVIDTTKIQLFKQITTSFSLIYLVISL